MKPSKWPAWAIALCIVVAAALGAAAIVPVLLYLKPPTVKCSDNVLGPRGLPVPCVKG